jgi:peptidoglycan/LPS O-acetylase OafA/YrhL
MYPEKAKEKPAIGPLALKQPSRFYRPELDVLRFVAFFGVFLQHMLQLRFPLARDIGGLGLCLFFVLSSFLITELLRMEKEKTGTIAFRNFYIRRVLRIWPLQYLFLAFAFCVGLLVPRLYMWPTALGSMLVFSGNWYIGQHGMVAAGGFAFALWSISLEEQFYLVWPTLCRYLSKSALIAFCLMLLPVAALTITHILHRGVKTDVEIWTNSLVQFQMFGMGALLAIFLNGRIPRIPALVRCAILLCGAALFVASETVFHTRNPSFTAPGGFIGAYLCAGLASTFVLFGVLGLGVPRWLKPIVYLGKISYGLYVFHVMCITLYGFWFGKTLGSGQFAIKFIITFGSACLLASLSYRFIEAPFIRLKERFTVVHSRGA